MSVAGNRRIIFFNSAIFLFLFFFFRYERETGSNSSGFGRIDKNDEKSEEIKTKL